MPVITSRTQENAKIIINSEKCNLCGLCIKICKDFSLMIDKNGKLIVSDKPVFGCFACGQCAAICPNEAIEIEGREFSKDDLIDYPDKESKSDYEHLHKLLLGRRSVRDFKDKQVEKEIIDKIVFTSSTAPMGIPPSDVGVLILDGKDKVKEFTGDFLTFVKKSMMIFNPVIMLLFRLFMSKESYLLFKNFAKPLYKILLQKWEIGEDWLLYNAPLSIYYYSCPYADPADPVIAATYSMIAAESLGLGSCMIGTIGPMLKSGSKKLKEKYGIHTKSNGGIMLIFGYPKYKFHKAIKRSFAKVSHLS